MITKTDQYGRVTITSAEIVEALYAGVNLRDLLIVDGSEISKFNTMCVRFDRPKYALKPVEQLEHSPQEEHDRRSNTWLFDDIVKDVDLSDILLSMCNTDEERSRVDEEMVLFRERGLEPLLHAMIYLVDHWKSNGVFWGVGRGSSVASFVLYLIGINRINPMKYGLSIQEFLR